jgi:hypothetical protein
MMSLRVTAAAAVLILAAGSASAATDLVSNGTFASNNVQNNPSAGLNVLFRDDPSASITDWTYTVPGGPSNNNGGIITVIATDDLNSSANINDGGGSNYGLWNAGNGGLAVITAPPSGDAQVMAQDSAPENTAYLSQTISGLTPGKSYQVTFAFAGLQLRSADGSQWNGDTNEAIEVNLGGTYDVGAGTASQTYTGGEPRALQAMPPRPWPKRLAWRSPATGSSAGRPPPSISRRRPPPRCSIWRPSAVPPVIRPSR